jgi:hypothetical protein
MLCLALACWARAEQAGSEAAPALKTAALLESAGRDFTPEGWRVEAEIAGDLNHDGRLDTILSLLQEKPDAAGERQRKLMVLLRARDNQLKRIAQGDRLLRCDGCQGAWAGADHGGPEIHIVKGVLIVREIWGSRETGETLLRFRHEPATGRMLLIGEELESNDRANGAKTRETTNWLTGIRTLEKTAYNEARQRLQKMPIKKQRLAKLKRYLDELNYLDYEDRVGKL